MIRPPTQHFMSDAFRVVARGGMLVLQNIPEPLRKEIHTLGRIPNPAYLESRRYSPWQAVRIPKVLQFFAESDNGTIVPRGMYDLLTSKPKAVVTVDERQKAPVTFPDLRITPNEQQAVALEAVRILRRKLSGSFLLIASTSVGKTILQATAASILGQRTLVLCPTDQIMRAWFADLRLAFGLTQNRVGVIRGSTFRVLDPITLATPQTIARRVDRWPEINSMFGTVVLDECHVVSAPTIYEFLVQSTARFQIGATATQESRKGPNHQLQMVFGKPAVEINTYGQNTKSSLHVESVRLVDSAFQYNPDGDIIDWYDLGLALTNDEQRNELVVKTVKQDWVRGRSILLVTKFREHVTLLQDMLLEAGVTNVNTITGTTNAQRFYTKRLLAAINNRKVTCVVATAQAIKIGANIPALDTLHVVVPPANRRDLEQLIGRIRRRAEGKTSAELVYYTDSHVGYLMHLLQRVAVPVFRHLQLPGYCG